MHSEVEWLAFAEQVRQEASDVAGMCIAENAPEACKLACRLVELAASMTNSSDRQQLRSYDLAALEVDTNTGSNSETG